MSAVVIGLGNTLRGDDGIGAAVARAVKTRRPEVTVRECRGEGLDLLDEMEGRSFAIVVDALSSWREPGSIVRLDASATDLPVDVFSPSSHAMGLTETLALARSLGRLPATVVVYGVEGATYGPGEGLSPPVAAAVPLVAERIAQDLDRLAV